MGAAPAAARSQAVLVGGRGALSQMATDDDNADNDVMKMKIGANVAMVVVVFVGWGSEPLAWVGGRSFRLAPPRS